MPYVFERQEYLNELTDQSGPFEFKMRSTPGPKFCITENGYMGWIPDVAEPGDRLCGLGGSRIIFTVCLYKYGYILLGILYIHGLMGGNACEPPDAVFEDITACTKGFCA